MGRRTEPSEGSYPGRSAFVESDRSRRTPRRPSAANAGRSVGTPSIGVVSSLKSPEWTISPSGVSNAMPAASGTEWVTGTNMNLNGLCSIHFLNCMERRSASTPSSSIRPRASSTASLVP